MLGFNLDQHNWSNFRLTRASQIGFASGKSSTFFVRFTISKINLASFKKKLQFSCYLVHLICKLTVLIQNLVAYSQRMSNQSKLGLISPISPTSPGLDWVTITFLTMD